MTNEGTIEAPGASNLAGIAVEHRNGVVSIFTVDRWSNHLFVYHWDADNKELTLEGGTYKELDYGGAMGIALDDINHHLYVTNASNIVHYYDTDTWTHQGSVDVGRIAYDIEVDAQRQYLYTGGYVSHDYLVKTWIGPDDPNDSGELDIGAGVIGLGLDPNSGLVYATTYHDELRVYDCSTSPFTLTDQENIAAGAGVCVSDVLYKPPTIKVTKDDGIAPADEPNCVVPGEQLTYDILLTTLDVQHNLWVIDTIPFSVDFVSAEPNNPVYNPADRTCTWYFSFYDPNEPSAPEYLYLTVQVNNGAEPSGGIENRVEAESDASYSYTTETTHVCCWDSGAIIYVDQNASGANSGTSWQHAYTDLQSALNRFNICPGSANQIRIAQGNYSPGSESDDTFNIPAGVALYGGFPAGGSDPQQRRWLNYETILSGNSVCENVVTLTDANEATVIDGFTIAASDGESGCGVYVNGGAPVITHNRFYNLDYGIYCVNSSAPAITNNVIYDNSTCGLYLDCPDPNTVIRNNTIAYNLADGVIKNGATPEPNTVLVNCILWENAHCQIIGCASGYSCVQDKINDPNGTNAVPDNYGNITANPYFADPENRDLHLEPNSPCIEAGDPDSACELESDIDGQWRIIDYYVDMGADEYCPGDDSNPADFNADGAVDLLDYSELANVWLLENTDPGWNALYDLVADNVIDLPDLDTFGQNWLWSACWNDSSSFGQGMMMEMDMGMGMSMSSPPQVLTSADDYQPPVELTPQQQIQRLEDNIIFLQDVWQTSPDIRAAFTEDDWSAWIESLAEQLGELEND